MTICTQRRECLFGDVADEGMRLNGFGIVIQEFWKTISNRFKNIELDEFIIMPNHMHGIIVISNNDCRTCRGEVSSPNPSSDSKPNHGDIYVKQGGETPPLQKQTLGRVIAHFKYQSAKRINQIRNTAGMSVWQRNYYEHVIRNDDELNRIREYIINNPLQWADDENNPMNIAKREIGAE